MTALTEWFCDYCNQSAQRRDEGDEANSGYARTLDHAEPEGWCEVPRLGPGRVGHACDACTAERPDVQEDIIRRRSDDTAVLLERLPLQERDPGGWPARTSPFGR